MRGLPLSLALAAAMSACAVVAPTQAPDDGRFYFPRHGDPLGTGDSALVEGVASAGDGCIQLALDDGSEMLVVWPADVELGRINDLPVVLAPAQQLPPLEMGTRIALGGSSTDLATAASLVGPIPERCATESVWIVSDILGRP